MKQFKIIIEKHSDGYVAYPVGVVGAVVGQGDTYEEALADVKSAITCYIEVFGKDILDDIPSVEVFIAEAAHFLLITLTQNAVRQLLPARDRQLLICS
jgi:predicted RNase H-like HicB family nuclease